jgi:hypothetical protein
MICFSKKKTNTGNTEKMNKSKKKFVLINNNLITEFDKPRNFKKTGAKNLLLMFFFTTNWLFQTNHSKKMTYSSPRQQHRSHSFSFYFYFRVLKRISLFWVWRYYTIIDWKHGWKSLEIYFVRFISL